MYQNIFYAIAVLFFAVGVCAVFILILLRLVAPDKNSRYFIVSVFSENDRDCAVKISCAESVITLFGLSDRCTIIAADSGLSEKERKKLEAAFRRDTGVIICDIGEAEEIMTR